MNDVLTRITKKVGDYFAKQFKDGDNTLFADISETAIDGFIEEIKKDNPVLASWVEDWRNNNLKEKEKKISTTKKKKSTTSTYSSGGCCDDDYDYGGCGSSSRKISSGGGCGSYYSGSRYGGC